MHPGMFYSNLIVYTFLGDISGPSMSLHLDILFEAMLLRTHGQRTVN